MLDQSADAEEGDRDRHAVSSPVLPMYTSGRGRERSCTLPVHTHGPWRNTLSARPHAATQANSRPRAYQLVHLSKGCLRT